MDNRTGKRQYYLKITNHETMLMFEKMIEDWFSEEDSAYGNFKDALIAGRSGLYESVYESGCTSDL